MSNKSTHRGVNGYKYKYWEHPKSQKEQVQNIPVSQLKPFEEQPFKVLMDESMDELVESIKESGVLSPIIARPHREGGYEILSGHRRAKACQIAGIKNVPVLVKNLDDDTATILLVDSNLQREHILPSEKAHAYRMKLEAMKRKAGRPSKENYVQIEHNFQGKTSRDELSQEIGESPAQVRRYIRLTELIDPLLDMVDEKKIPLNAAVELSYLGSKAQSEVVKSIEKNETTPSIEQSSKIRKLSQVGMLDQKRIDKVMQQPKTEKIRITLKEDKLSKYFSSEFTPKEIEDTIIKLLDDWYKKKHRNKDMER